MKKILIGTLALATGLGTYTVHKAMSDDTDKIFLNRQWIDKLPTAPTELVSIFAFVGTSDGMGVEASVSQWRQHVDMFFWKSRENQVVSRYPQTEERVDFTNIKAYECDQDPFELCLEMTVNGQNRKYYSRWDWEVEGLADAQRLHITNIR